MCAFSGVRYNVAPRLPTGQPRIRNTRFMANVLVVMPAAAGRDVVHPVLYAPPRTHKRAPGERPDSSRYPLTPTVHPSFMPVCVLAIASGWVIMSDRFVPRSMAGRNTACGAQATGARPGRPRCRRRCHARCWWRTNPDARMHICPVCCRCPAAYPRTRRVLALVRKRLPGNKRAHTPHGNRSKHKRSHQGRTLRNMHAHANCSPYHGYAKRHIVKKTPCEERQTEQEAYDSDGKHTRYQRFMLGSWPHQSTQGCQSKHHKPTCRKRKRQ